VTSLSTSFDDLASLLGWENVTVHAGLATDDKGFSVKLLGGFRLFRDGQAVELADSSRRLIALLAVLDRPLLRGFVAGTLWADTEEERASACLRSTLWRIRGVAVGLIDADGSQLQLADDVSVDLHHAKEFAGALVAGKCAWADGDPQLLEVGDLLESWSDEWVEIEREVFRQVRLHALEVLCAQLASAGLFGRAVVAGLTAVQADPLRESAHRVLIGAHLAEGNAGEALRQYDAYRGVLERELGLEPSEALTEVVTRLRRGVSRNVVKSH